METDQFYAFFLPELKLEGYEGIFSPKSRAKTMTENERKHVDGCAIFWRYCTAFVSGEYETTVSLFRTSKFSLVKEHLIEFNQVAMANAEGCDVMLNRVMTKDNIALAALLETKDQCWENGIPNDAAQARQPLLVTTAHIHWDPEFCDVKLIQTMMLIDQLKQITEETCKQPSFRPGGQKCDPSSIQVLLCGDFNSLPESGVIEYLQRGRVRYLLRSLAFTGPPVYHPCSNPFQS